MNKNNELSDVSFPDSYPPHGIAEHEVFMSFRDDEDAAFFREWWWAKGEAAFKKWLKSRPTVDQ